MKILYAPPSTKSEKAILGVKVTRSLNLVSFELASGVCMANMKSLSLTIQVLAKVRVDNRQTG